MALADKSESERSGVRGARMAPVEIDPNKPARNVVNYQQPAAETRAAGKPLVIRLLPAKSLTSQSKTKRPNRKKRRAKAREVKSQRAARRNSHQSWWDRKGNLLVHKFRDCLAEYATKRKVPETASGPAIFISQAMDEDCHTQFDAMAGTISGRFGQARFEKLSAQLITDVFLPAVISARRSDALSAQTTNGG